MACVVVEMVTILFSSVIFFLSSFFFSVFVFNGVFSHVFQPFFFVQKQFLFRWYFLKMFSEASPTGTAVARQVAPIISPIVNNMFDIDC